MMPGDGSEPLADDELVFRRVSVRSGWYNPQSDRPFAWEAFKPNKGDRTGLSVWRAKYKTPVQAAAGTARRGSQYYILVLKVGRLREAGIEVNPSPEEGGSEIGHASLIDINYSAYEADKNRIRELANTIAESLIERVEGPFGPFEEAE